MDNESPVTEPLVTCAMVTRPFRRELARESARCFARQTHRNRELVVVTADAGKYGDAELAAMEETIRSEAGERVRFYRYDEPLEMGPQRNRTVANAQGAFICVWDDDDIYHPTRIATQLAATLESGLAASYFTEVIHYFVDDKVAWLCNWKNAPQGGHPGTGLFRAGLAQRYPETGREAQWGEDTTFAVSVRAAGGIAQTPGVYYLYRFTGGNLWGREHHQGLVDKMAISKALLLRREPELRARLAELGVPAGIELRGSNGAAFVT